MIGTNKKGRMYGRRKKKDFGAVWFPDSARQEITLYPELIRSSVDFPVLMMIFMKKLKKF